MPDYFKSLKTLFNNYKRANQKIQYDTQIEVTGDQYKVIMQEYPSMCAGRCDEVQEKYYVKLWNPKARNLLKEILQS